LFINTLLMKRALPDGRALFRSIEKLN